MCTQIPCAANSNNKTVHTHRSSRNIQCLGIECIGLGAWLCLVNENTEFNAGLFIRNILCAVFSDSMYRILLNMDKKKNNNNNYVLNISECDGVVIAKKRCMCFSVSVKCVHTNSAFCTHTYFSSPILFGFPVFFRHCFISQFTTAYLYV